MPPNILSPFWLSILIPTALASLFVLWWMLGPGPHRARRLRKVRKFLQQGDWSKALEHLRGKGRPSGRWKRRFDEAEAECLQTAVNQALKEKNFDLALERALAMVQHCKVGRRQLLRPKFKPPCSKRCAVSFRPAPRVPFWNLRPSP